MPVPVVILSRPFASTLADRAWWLPYRSARDADVELSPRSHNRASPAVAAVPDGPIPQAATSPRVASPKSPRGPPPRAPSAAESTNSQSHVRRAHLSPLLTNEDVLSGVGAGGGDRDGSGGGDGGRASSRGGLPVIPAPLSSTLSGPRFIQTSRRDIHITQADVSGMQQQIEQSSVDSVKRKYRFQQLCVVRHFLSRVSSVGSGCLCETTGGPCVG